jgi:hypothetical protein
MHENVMAPLCTRKSESETLYQSDHIRKPDVFRSCEYLLKYLSLGRHFVGHPVVERLKSAVAVSHLLEWLVMWSFYLLPAFAGLFR